MSDVSAPQRKRGGRPRKHTPDAKRLSMTFRVNESLHKKIEASAQTNGRSLSEEIERLLENYFDRGEYISVEAQKIAEAAAKGAANAAKDQINRQYERIFGGSNFLYVASDMADLFRDCLVSTAKELNVEDPERLGASSAEILAEKLAQGQLKIANGWFQRIEAVNILSFISDDDPNEYSKTPAGRRAVEEITKKFFASFYSQEKYKDKR